MSALICPTCKSNVSAEVVASTRICPACNNKFIPMGDDLLPVMRANVEELVAEDVQHRHSGEITVWHNSTPAGPKISLKVERNSRGTNVEISVSGAASPEEAVALFAEAEMALNNHLNPPKPAVPAQDLASGADQESAVDF